jgi:diguanylate cyclase (GGDEF)-like protein/PAS domain S-box-containing protein
MDVLADHQCALGLGDVKSDRYQREYRTITSKTLNFGLTSSVFWLRFRLELSPDLVGSDMQTRIFDPGIAFPGRVKWSLYDGRADQPMASGGSRTAKASFAEVLVEPAPRDYYLRIQSTTGLMLNPRLYTRPAYLEHTRVTMVWLGVFYGIIFAVAAYNLFLFFSFNDRSYLWYVLHLASVMLYFLCINGLVGNYLLSIQPELLGKLSRSFLGLVTVFMALLAHSFFSSHVRSSKINRLFLVAFVAACVLTILNLLLPARIINSLLIAIGLVAPFTMSLAAWYALRSGFTPARFFLVAYGLFFVGVLLFASVTGGLIPFSSISFFAFQIGTALTAVLLSFALGDRIRILRLERASLKRGMDRVATIMDSVECGIFLIEINSWTIKEINQSAVRILGDQHKKIVGQPCWKFIPSGPKGFSGGNELFMGNEPREDILISVSGKKVPVLRRAKRINLDGSDLILASFSDISELKRAEVAVRRSEEKFRSLFESSRDAIMILDHDCFVDCNPATLEMFRCEKATQFLGRHLSDFSPEKQPSGVDSKTEADRQIQRAVLQGSLFFEWVYRRQDGELFPTEVMLSSIETGEKRLVQSLVRDITQRKAMENELKHLAETDPLTGANNRRSFLQKGASEMRRSQRYNHPFSLLMLDIDHFKSVNDTYGHHAGDQVLKMLVARIAQMLRTTDLFGRMGGEEFAVMLLETDAETAMEIAERLRRELSEVLIELDQGSIQFTVSIGVAFLKNDDKSLAMVINRADEALYIAKETGRNRVVRG